MAEDFEEKELAPGIENGFLGVALGQLPAPLFLKESGEVAENTFVHDRPGGEGG
jgi:hypothetical protein